MENEVKQGNQSKVDALSNIFNRKRQRNMLLATIASSVLIYSFVVGQATYPPSDEALLAMQSDEIVRVTTSSQYISFEPSGIDFGGTIDEATVIYPHDDIDPSAYAPLARIISEQFHTSVYIVDYWAKQSFFGIRKGNDLQRQFPEIEVWHGIYHGNGGIWSNISSSNYASLTFLSSFPLIGFDTDIPVMVVRGALDEVNGEALWQKKRKLFPSSSIFYELEQGNFSYFASFGILSEDSAGMISPPKQRQLTLEFIEDFRSGL